MGTLFDSQCTSLRRDEKNRAKVFALSFFLSFVGRRPVAEFLSSVFSGEGGGGGRKNRLTVRFRRFRRVAGDLISRASCEVISLHLICCFRPNAGLALLRSLNRTRAHSGSDSLRLRTQNTLPTSNQPTSLSLSLFSMCPPDDFSLTIFIPLIFYHFYFPLMDGLMINRI